MTEAFRIHQGKCEHRRCDLWWTQHVETRLGTFLDAAEHAGVETDHVTTDVATSRRGARIKHGDGRTRYHGRGKQGRDFWVEDALDLDQAIKELELARVELRSIDRALTGKALRKARVEPLARVELARRYVTTLLERYGGNRDEVAVPRAFAPKKALLRIVYARPPLREQVDSLCYERIGQALATTGGNLKNAARLLAIPESSIYKMRRAGKVQPTVPRKLFRPLTDEIVDLEKRRIREAMAEAKGVRTTAAAMLGTYSNALTMKILEYGLDVFVARRTLNGSSHHEGLSLDELRKSTERTMSGAKQKYAERVKRKVCVHCEEPVRPGLIRCTSCREVYRDKRRATAERAGTRDPSRDRYT